MKISARVQNTFDQHQVIVSTNDREQSVAIAAKKEGLGSSVNGGELLLLSLATCFCNDVYREAARRKMNVALVEVTVNGEFDKEGEPGYNIVYSTRVEAPGSSDVEIEELIEYVDRIAEIHNTLRKGVEVRRILRDEAV
ncbi:MAG: osmotically inducible protein OsmC [Citrobacter freundii]|nr:MAG: osmotically inducible protein OsmC [Citrobacter freundii]